MNDQATYFDDPTHRYQHALNPPLAQRLEMEHLEKALGKISGKNILEFGAGSGRVSFWFLKRGFDDTAVDVSPNSLRDLRRLYARKRRASWGSLTTMKQLPTAGAYDLVVGADILHHVEIKTYLPKLYTLLKPGGCIAFSEPNAWHIPWYVHWMREKIPWHIEKGVLQCTRRNLFQQLSLTGFQDIRIIGHGLFPTRFLESMPLLCAFNARVLGNLPITRWFAFRFVIAARKPE